MVSFVLLGLTSMSTAEIQEGLAKQSLVAETVRKAGTATKPPKMDSLSAGYLVVGKYMMYVPKMTQKHFDGAVKTAEAGQPMYYKSEFAEGTWYKLQDVVNIYDISILVSQNIEKASVIDRIKFMVQVNEKGEVIKFGDEASDGIDGMKADIAKKKSEIANAIDGVDPVAAQEAVAEGEDIAVLTPEKLEAGKANPDLADAMDRLEGELVELENNLIAVLLSLEGEEAEEGQAMLQERLDEAFEEAKEAGNTDQLFETIAEMASLDPENVPSEGLGLVTDALVDELKTLLEQTKALLADAQGFVEEEIEEAEKALEASGDKISNLEDELSALEILGDELTNKNDQLLAAIEAQLQAAVDDQLQGAIDAKRQELKEAQLEADLNAQLQAATNAQLQGAIDEEKDNSELLADLKGLLEQAIIEDNAKDEVLALLELAVLEHEAKAEAIAELAEALKDYIEGAEEASAVAGAVAELAGNIDVEALDGENKDDALNELLAAVKEGNLLPEDVLLALEDLGEVKADSTWLDDTYADLNHVYSLIDKMRMHKDYIDMYIKENDDDNLHSKELILAIVKQIDIEIAMMKDEAFISYDLVKEIYNYKYNQRNDEPIVYSEYLIERCKVLLSEFDSRLVNYEDLKAEDQGVEKVNMTESLDIYIFRNFLVEVIGSGE